MDQADNAGMLDREQFDLIGRAVFNKINRRATERPARDSTAGDLPRDEYQSLPGPGPHIGVYS